MVGLGQKKGLLLVSSDESNQSSRKWARGEDAILEPVKMVGERKSF